VRGVSEFVVEDAALAWLEGVGWSVARGVEIAPGEPGAEREEYGQVVLSGRLRSALRLTAVRDTLLPKLISGELRVQDVEGRALGALQEEAPR